MGSDASDGLEALEIELLTEGIFRHYGVDFRHYAYASLRRRIWNSVRAEKLATITQLLDRVLHDTESMELSLIHI